MGCTIRRRALMNLNRRVKREKVSKMSELSDYLQFESLYVNLC